MAQEVAVAAAAIAALPCGFAAEEETLQVLRALLDLALGLPDEFAASLAAAAAASIVNKAAQGAHSPQSYYDCYQIAECCALPGRWVLTTHLSIIGKRHEELAASIP